MDTSIQALFADLSQTALWSDEMRDNWNTYLQSRTSEGIQDMLSIDSTSEDINNLNVSDLMRAPFPKAKGYIDQFTMAKRIQVLEDLDTHRTYLYDQASEYGAEGIPKEEALSVNDWKIIMGKIKHLEILQAWLYGIE